MIHKIPSTRQRPHPAYIYEIAELDNNAKYLIGWPGYRTSQIKSGLGYIETRAEMAHMQGLMFRWLITGKFRTHNPLYLCGMALVGMICGAIPFSLMVWELQHTGNWAILLWLVFPYPIIGISVLLLINVILSIVDWDGKTITGD